MYIHYSPDIELLILCFIFSFSSSLIKQLYDIRLRKRNFSTFCIDVLLSAMLGTIFALLFYEFNKKVLVVLGFSGLFGMFGTSAIKLLIQFKLGRRIKIEIGFDDENK